MTREEAWRRTKGYLYDVLSGEEADEIIKALEQKPETGHWIIYDVHGHKACKCSECGMDVGYPCNDKFCKYCGIKMVEPQERSGVK